MTLTLGSFHTEVSNEMNKGTTYDTYIPLRAQMAARRIERNYTFKYMERYVEFTQQASIDCPRAIPHPNAYLKSIKFLRYFPADGEDYIRLKQVDPLQHANNAVGSPVAFWLDGLDYIWLDCDFTDDIDFEFSFNQFTAWEKDNSAFTSWLLDHGTDLLLAETMMLMAPITRENEWAAIYEDMRTRAERTLFLADQELRESVTDDAMIYGG